jgi:predicted nuclease of predicted toxin-antitoxin system
LKILLDHNLDRRLKNSLLEHETSTTQEQGWADVVNGELLRLAESNGFVVLLTAHANIKNQQNLSDRMRCVRVRSLRSFTRGCARLTTET